MREPRCVVCNKREDSSRKLIELSDPLNIHSCERHWTLSWIISALVFLGGIAFAVVVIADTPGHRGFQWLKALLILLFAPLIVHQFVASLRDRRRIVKNREDASRCASAPDDLLDPYKKSTGRHYDK